MGKTLVVGIGNPARGDDGAGCAVVELMEMSPLPGVTLSKQKGDIAQLLELFSAYNSVYLIDACQMSKEQGSWRRIDAKQQTLPMDNKPTSTHGFTLIEAIELAKNLEQLPTKLIVYAIAGHHFSMYEGLSPTVAEAIKEVKEAILKEIEACTKKV